MLRPSAFKWTVRANVFHKSQTKVKKLNKERFEVCLSDETGMVRLSGSCPRAKSVFEQLNVSKVYFISNLHAIEDFNGSIELQFMRSTRASETNL